MGSGGQAAGPSLPLLICASSAGLSSCLAPGTANCAAAGLCGEQRAACRLCCLAMPGSDLLLPPICGRAERLLLGSSVMQGTHRIRQHALRLHQLWEPSLFTFVRLAAGLCRDGHSQLALVGNCPHPDVEAAAADALVIL